MHSRAATALALLVAALGAAAKPARANGRFPLAQQLVVDDDDPSRLTLAATFGLLTSADRGRNWYYTCERAFAFEAIEGDALLARLPDGTLFSGIARSLNASTDCGCTWAARAAAEDTDGVVDVTASDDGVVALLRSVETPSTFRLERSPDGVQAFTLLTELPSDIGIALTVDVAPSNASRVYVSALSTSGSGLLLVSDDGGASFDSHSIADTGIARQPYIAAVHPENADVVFVRTDAWEEADDGFDEGNDALLYSDDAGVSFIELIRRGGKLFGFALSPDHGALVVGYGDPVQAARYTVTEDLGIYRASTADFAFELVTPASVSCLRWTASGVYACFEENHPELAAPFSLGVAGADFTGTLEDAFTPLLQLAAVRGPLACNADVCLDDWQVGDDMVLPACQRLGANCNVDPTSNVVECMVGASGAASGTTGSGGTNAGGTNASGENSTSGGAPSAGAGGGNAPGGEATKGCTCDLSPSRRNGDWLAVLFSLLGIAKLALRPKRVRLIYRLGMSRSAGSGSLY